MSPRIGVRAGPFYASGSTRGSGPWIATFFFLVIAVGLAVEHPYVSVAVVAGIVALIVWRVAVVRRRNAPPPPSETAQGHAEPGRCVWCDRDGGQHWAHCPAAPPKQQEPAAEATP